MMCAGRRKGTLTSHGPQSLGGVIFSKGQRCFPGAEVGPRVGDMRKLLANLTSHRMSILLFRKVGRAWRYFRKRYLFVASFLLPGLLTGRLRFRLMRPLEHLKAEATLLVSGGASVSVSRARPHNYPTETIEISQGEVSARRVSAVFVELGQDWVSVARRFYRQAPLTPNRADVKQELYSRGIPFSKWCQQSPTLLWNWGRVCLIQEKGRAEIKFVPRGVVINGTSPGNWYHWIINVLPKAAISGASPLVPGDIPILVARTANGGAFEEALRLVLGKEREVQFFAEDEVLLVGDAYVIDTPVPEIVHVRGHRDLDWSNLGGFNCAAMKLYREIFLRALKSSPDQQATGDHSKIFLSRAGTTRPINQEEVRVFLEQRGFVSIVLEDFSLLEQLAIFASAKTIVSTTGAQWTGFLFTTAAAGVILIPKFLSGSTLFSKLGSLGGSSLTEVPLQTRHERWWDFFASEDEAFVDLDILGESLDALEGQT